MQETKERFFIYISKLEDKLKEFAEASIPELIKLNNTDTDEFKREYLRMKSAVLGQLENILKKSREVQEEKITGFQYSEKDSFAYYEFRNECYDRLRQLEDLHHQYQRKIEATHSEDYEIKNQKILDEHETIKDKFRCTQCGSPIFIDKIYFTTTYITCLSCGIQNTFEPSSQTKMLEHLGRNLAEQRTKHLLEEYEINSEKSLVLYEKYLRAMFDEWNKINPDMQEEHEKFYNRLLNDYNKPI